MATTIPGERRVVTPLNAFAVGPERRPELVQPLIEATEQLMRYPLGFARPTSTVGSRDATSPTTPGWRRA